MNATSKLTKTDLEQFTGTEHYYRHSINRKVLFTDGVKYVADKAGASYIPHIADDISAYNAPQISL